MASFVQNAAGVDRRSSPRWHTDLSVRYGRGEPLAEGRGLDISETGIGFTGPQLCPVGTDIEVCFRMDSPTADWFRARAVVRNVNAQRMGAEFVGLGSADRMRILEMIYKDIAMRRR